MCIDQRSAGEIMKKKTTDFLQLLTVNKMVCTKITFPLKFFGVCCLESPVSGIYSNFQIFDPVTTTL